MLTDEATNTNCIVFSLTRSGLKPTIYRTRCEYANHYTGDAVVIKWHCVITKINELNWYYKENKLTVDSTMR